METKEILSAIQNHNLSAVMLYTSLAKIANFMSLNDFKRIFKYERNKEVLCGDKISEYSVENHYCLLPEPTIKTYFDIESRYRNMKSSEVENIQRTDFLKDAMKRVFELKTEYKRILSRSAAELAKCEDHATRLFVEKLLKKATKELKKCNRRIKMYEKVGYSLEYLTLTAQSEHDKYAEKSAKIGFKAR